MIAVIFEVDPHPDHRDDYFAAATALRPLLDRIEGFISVERFESLSTPGKLLSLSFFRDEDAVTEWRRLSSHRKIQAAGRETMFRDYRLRVAEVSRDYGLTRREQVPRDSLAFHD